MSRPFQFKQFTIQQTANSQKVGTDSMLLGAWVQGKFQRILDIGTGTGILALMLAQKNPQATITAIEPDLASLQEAHLNFQSSPFRSQLLAVQSRLQDFGSLEKFDLIITNPPYFENAYLSADADRNRARHTDDLPVYELYEFAAELLAENGVMALIIPVDEEANHIHRAAYEDLFPAKIMRTLRADGTYKRSLIQFSFDDVDPIISELLVKDADNKYSQEYIALTQDFYGKNLNDL